MALDTEQVSGIGWKNWVRLCALGVIWGGSFLLVELAVEDFPPATVAAMRLIVAACIMVPLAIALRGGLPKGGRIWIFAIAGALFSKAIPFTLLSWGQTHIASGLAGVFMAVLPLIVLPLSAIFIPGEHLTQRKVFGLMIGFVGMLVLLGFDTLLQLGGAPIEVIAQLACLGAAICYATGSIILKRAPRTDPLAFGAAMMLVAAICSGGWALSIESPFDSAPHAPSVIAVLALGIFPTALALVLLLQIVDEAGPPFLSLVNYQVPIWAILFGAVFLGEIIPERLPVALALILSGIAVSQGLIRLPRKAVRA